jgi:hypothetical protein
MSAEYVYGEAEETPMPEAEELAYQQSLALLRSCLTPAGFVASAQDVDNYGRVWARDGVITGLAALASGDSDLIVGMERTLDTLAKYQGPHGEIPSNVSVDGGKVSYGYLVGRVDALLWYIIGVCAYLNYSEHASKKVRYWLSVEKALFLAECWEYNNRGFVYTPQAGNWADEYVQQGYVLSDQLLYMLALSSAGAAFSHKNWQKKATLLQAKIAANYWPLTAVIESEEGLIYHPHAYRLPAERGDTKHWLAAFSSTGYVTYFDGLAHALSLITNLGNQQQRVTAEAYVQSIALQTDSQLLPAFWPVIQREDPQWTMLEANHLYGEVKNQPYMYHNGGLWPTLSGFYVLGLMRQDMRARAEQVTTALHNANAQGSDGRTWDFAEYHHGETLLPMGTRHLARSAAASVLAHQAVYGAITPWPL